MHVAALILRIPESKFTKFGEEMSNVLTVQNFVTIRKEMSEISTIENLCSW